MRTEALRFAVVACVVIAGLYGIQTGANAAPANDNLANATVIVGKPAPISGTNVGATKETNEPSPNYNCQGDSVWYRWKPTTSGGVTFTATSNIRTALGVYVGPDVSHLIGQTEFQPGLGTTTSEATFNAVAGTTYYLLVDDYAGDTGTFTLTWHYGPGNDNFARAAGISGKTIHASGTNVDSSAEPNEPKPYYYCNGRSVWYHWTAPASGGVTVTAACNFNCVLGVYVGPNVSHLIDVTDFRPGAGTTTSQATFNAVAGTTYDVLVDDANGDTGKFTLSSVWGPANDNFASATALTGNTFSAKGTNINSSTEPNEPKPYYYCNGRSVWYHWTAPASGGVTVTAACNFNCVLGVYVGPDVSHLIDVTDFRPGAGTTTSEATFNAVAGTIYYVLVDDANGDTGTFTLSSVWGPANDNFANAVSVTGATGSVSGTNINSSTEPNEPKPYYYCNGRSVWYRWTAPASGGVTFTAACDFNCVLGVYTGPNASHLTDQAEFRPGAGTTTSEVTFNAIGGTTYSVLVDDANGDTGNFALGWYYGPSNDNFANAIGISGRTGSVTGTNVDSSAEANEPRPYYYCNGRSVWYRWTAPVSGGVTITASTDFNCVLGVYTGNSVGQLTDQTTSRTGAGTTTTTATFSAVAGTTYSILVDDANGDTGTFTLSWSE